MVSTLPSGAAGQPQGPAVTQQGHFISLKGQRGVIIAAKTLALKDTLGQAKNLFFPHTPARKNWPACMSAEPGCLQRLCLYEDNILHGKLIWHLQA